MAATATMDLHRTRMNSHFQPDATLVIGPASFYVLIANNRKNINYNWLLFVTFGAPGTFPRITDLAVRDFPKDGISHIRLVIDTTILRPIVTRYKEFSKDMEVTRIQLVQNLSSEDVWRIMNEVLPETATYEAFIDVVFDRIQADPTFKDPESAGKNPGTLLWEFYNRISIL